MQEFNVQLRVPDLWQQEAIRALQDGSDVVVDAPTGSGKTYIFELLVEAGGLHGQAVYTVPTRALANDKLLEWRRKGWNVGISTGDIAENLDAPVLVATLEAQKHRLISGKGPDLLVVDEYQMIADAARGVNYELVIAMLSPETKLLLMSGSVGNAGDVVAWLKRLKRKATLVSHRDRPVPLEEVHVEGLPNNIPSSIHGYWPRLVAKALKAGVAPLLIFAPMRKTAETIARQLAAALPEEDPLVLTAEQKALAGETLTRLLKARITYHHSGLDYKQRAGLIEPLAKAGQLRVVVATMGLSSGINFSLRSVLVSDREYRGGDRYHLVRPDELLQMFGRAGRRGLDKKGYILVIPDKPRFAEARPLQLKRASQVDWPALIGLMHKAISDGEDPVDAARTITGRLYSQERVTIGLAEFLSGKRSPRSGSFAKQTPSEPVRQTYIEILNSEGKWERKRAPVRVPLGEALIFDGGEYRPALASAKVLESVAGGLGNICKLSDGPQPRYGRELPIARLDLSEEGSVFILTKWVTKQLSNFPNFSRRLKRGLWTYERIQKEILPILPTLTGGATPVALRDRSDGVVVSRLDYSSAPIFALVDTMGRPLIDPPSRESAAEMPMSFRELMGAPPARKSAPVTRPQNDQSQNRRSAPTAVEAWFDLGLIDERLRPTRRGVIFSFFNHGEGLAVAAALEDQNYALEELVFDLANLRAGHRFSEHEEYSSRLGNTCRMAYRGATYPGYLIKGVPTDYGDGAAEILQGVAANPHNRHQFVGDHLSTGDIERAQLEWRSLLNHIAHAPDYDWDRWMDFRRTVRYLLDGLPQRPFSLTDFPALTVQQMQRHKSFLKFD